MSLMLSSAASRCAASFCRSRAAIARRAARPARRQKRQRHSAQTSTSLQHGRRIPGAPTPHVHAISHTPGKRRINGAARLDPGAALRNRWRSARARRRSPPCRPAPNRLCVTSRVGIARASASTGALSSNAARNVGLVEQIDDARQHAAGQRHAAARDEGDRHVAGEARRRCASRAARPRPPRPSGSASAAAVTAAGSSNSRRRRPCAIMRAR